MLAYADIESTLRRAVPEFSSEIDEHLSLYGELLAHVLFGDLTRFTLAAHERCEDPLVSRILAFLDSALRDGDDQVVNLVQVSFVENVSPWDPDSDAFITTWPPALRIESENQKNSQPG